MTWYGPGGAKLTLGESCVIRKARLEPPVLPAAKEVDRMPAADSQQRAPDLQIEAKMFLVREKHHQDIHAFQQHGQCSRVQKGKG